VSSSERRLRFVVGLQYWHQPEMVVQRLSKLWFTIRMLDTVQNLTVPGLREAFSTTHVIDTKGPRTDFCLANRRATCVQKSLAVGSIAE
jgi:hypothetical protein